MRPVLRPEDAHTQRAVPGGRPTAGPRSRLPAGLRAAGQVGIAAAALLGLASCELAEPYLIPTRSLELVTGLQPDLRSSAQLPAVRERDRGAVLVRYGALRMDLVPRPIEQTVEQLKAHKTRFLRTRAARQNRLSIIGGVVMGMAAPHLAVGLGLSLDKGPGESARNWQDAAGGGLMFGLGGVHLAVGALLMFMGEFRPQVEPSDPGILYQYLDGVPLPPLPGEPAGPGQDPDPAKAPGKPGSTLDVDAPAPAAGPG